MSPKRTTTLITSIGGLSRTACMGVCVHNMRTVSSVWSYHTWGGVVAHFLAQLGGPFLVKPVSIVTSTPRLSIDCLFVDGRRRGRADALFFSNTSDLSLLLLAMAQRRAQGVHTKAFFASFRRPSRSILTTSCSFFSFHLANWWLSACNHGNQI